MGLATRLIWPAHGIQKSQASSVMGHDTPETKAMLPQNQRPMHARAYTWVVKASSHSLV